MEKRFKGRHWGILLVISILLPVTLKAQEVLKDLSCEYLSNPLTIEKPFPRLSWKIGDSRQGAAQSAYQILVASDKAKLAKNEADLWNSEKIDSDQSVNVKYEGLPLKSGQRIFWKVRYWDQNSIVSRYSQPAFWEMGILDPADWTAKLIRMEDEPVFSNDAVEKWMKYIIEVRKQGSEGQSGRNFIKTQMKPAPYFRREFELSTSPEKAKLLIASLGYYELYINGKRVGDRVLDPAFQEYDRQIYYVAHDVSSYLKKGKNAIAVVLGNGWYNQQGQFFGKPLPSFTTYVNMLGNKGLILQMDVTDKSQKKTRIVSDNEWKTSYGPLLRDQLFIGEVYDARREMPGWDSPGFDDSDWEKVEVVDPPLQNLKAMLVPPERSIREVKAKKILEPWPGIYVADLGETFSGWPKIRVRAPEGTMIVVRPSPYIRNRPQFMNGSYLPYSDPQLINKSIENMIGGELRSRLPDAEKETRTSVHNADLFVCNGNGEEIFQRSFSYAGFRYVELIGLPTKPDLEDISGMVVHTDLPRTGTFECSDEKVNELYDSFERTILYCTHGLVNDNSDAEKNSFRGHQACAGDFLAYAWNSPQFWAKAVSDIQLQTIKEGEYKGLPPTKAPAPPYFHKKSGKVVLNAVIDAGVESPRALLFSGNIDLVQENFPYMKQFVELFAPIIADPAPLDEHILVHGDWLDVWKDGERPQAGVGASSDGDMVYRTWFLIVLNRIVESAKNLDDPIETDIEEMRCYQNEIRKTINQKFYNTSKKSYGSQAANVLALEAEIVPEGDAQAVADELVRQIMDEWNGHLSVGFIGVRFISSVLSKYGYADIAHHLWNVNTWPSWRWLYEDGYDVTNSYWNDFHKPGVFPSARFIQSEKPVAAIWVYEAVAGIIPVYDKPGYKHFKLCPKLSENMTWARATVETAYGEILSDWKKEDEMLIYKVKIPPNTSATVFVPLLGNKQVSIEKPGETYPRFVAQVERYGMEFSKYNAKAGEYVFTVR